MAVGMATGTRRTRKTTVVAEVAPIESSTQKTLSARRRGVRPDPEKILDDPASLRETMRRIVPYTSEAACGLECLQVLSPQVSEELDAYQYRRAR
jgi:hypothetical protein